MIIKKDTFNTTEWYLAARNYLRYKLNKHFNWLKKDNKDLPDIEDEEFEWLIDDSIIKCRELLTTKYEYLWNTCYKFLIKSIFTSYYRFKSKESLQIQINDDIDEEKNELLMDNTSTNTTNSKIDVSLFVDRVGRDLSTKHKQVLELALKDKTNEEIRQLIPTIRSLDTITKILKEVKVKYEDEFSEKF